MELNTRRLYIFTGKGGVGKSTISRAFVRHLIGQNHEAVYLTFQNQSLGEKHRGTTEKSINGIKEISLDLEESARGYAEKKLGSKIIASWVVKTPFFRALVNMMPGFSYLIYLGKILEMGKENPKLIVVLDAPASGHALTMVEATTNFKQIFESGVIFDDTSKMLALLNDPKYTKINIVSLPSLMSWQEAMELRAGLRDRTTAEISVTINNCLYPILETQLDQLPPGLYQKAINEKTLVEANLSEAQCVLPYSLAQSSLGIETELVGSLGKLI